MAASQGQYDRVRKALEHKEPDRVPFDLGSTGATGISYSILHKLAPIFGMDERHVEIGDRIQQLGRLTDEMLVALEVDTRGLGRRPPDSWQDDLRTDPNGQIFTDEWKIEWRMPTDGLYFDMVSHPLADVEDISDLEKFAWPSPLDQGRYMDLAQKANLYREQDCAVVMAGLCHGTMEVAMWLRGFEQFFIDLACQPGLACAIMDRIVELKMQFWEAALPLVGNKVLVAREGDDLGHQNGLLISAEMYRKYVKPRHARLIHWIKSKASSPIYVYMHSCGAIRPLIPDLIECGVDILNPVQVSAEGMDPVALKRDFGNGIVFWGGGADSQRILSFGTPAQVKDEVKRCLDALAPGGGFIFAPIHNIQSGTPIENVLAMLEAFRENRNYQS